eukprot:7012791-Pyramimonas_sp.AAC.2
MRGNVTHAPMCELVCSLDAMLDQHLLHFHSSLVTSTTAVRSTEIDSREKRTFGVEGGIRI